MKLRIAKIEALAEGIKSFELRDPEEEILPAFSSGAHIRLNIAPDLSRRYSLTSDPSDTSHYSIAVLRHARGRASAWLHEQVRPGDLVAVEGPISGFPLVSAAHSILMAGGIGITPILSHARELKRQGASFEVHYAARSRARMALKAEVLQQADERATFYFDDESQTMPIRAVLRAAPPGSRVFVCGPAGLLDAVRDTASNLGWQNERIHFENFGPVWHPTDDTVRLELAMSGLSLEVPVGKTLIEAMEEAGVWVPFDCRRGECRTCMTQVVEGEPIHRDQCLTPQERAVAMLPCVSWAKGRVVLDL